MNVMRRVVTIFVVTMFCASTLFMTNPFMDAKASEGQPEIPLDTDFIYNITENLSKRFIDFSKYFQSRYYGTEGEINASKYLEDCWKGNISTTNIIRQKIDKGIIDAIDNKYDIHDRSDIKLKIGGDVIFDTEIFPALGPCRTHNWNNARIIITDETLYGKAEESLKKGNNFNDYPRAAEYVLLNDSGGVSGEVVYIEDYLTASKNDTEGKIHLLEFASNENNDVFNEKVQQVEESEGIGFIAIATNPSFIDKIYTNVTGVAISENDGNRIKMNLSNNETVFVDIVGDPVSESGYLTIYQWKEEGSCWPKNIYLIDAKELQEREINLFDMVEFLWKFTWKITNKRPNAHGFLCDYYNEDVTISDSLHNMVRAGLKGGIDGRGFVTFMEYILPGFLINRTLSSEIVNKSAAEFIHKTYDDRFVPSYNVIGTINGKISNKFVVIGAHYDSYWSPSAVDNAAAVGALFAIAKFFKDNNITPEYTLKFIAFGGEDLGCRGSKHYVWKYWKWQGKPQDKFQWMICIDTIAYHHGDYNIEDVTFNIWNTTYSGSMELIENLEAICERANYNTRSGGYDYFVRDTIEKCGPSDWKSFAYIDKNGKKVVPNAVLAIDKGSPSNPPTAGHFHHRDGEKHTKGDTLDLVVQDDLNVSAEIISNITKFLAIEQPDNEFVSCEFTTFDQSGNGQDDSVNISFNATTNLTSLATAKARLYNITTGNHVSCINKTSFTVYKDENVSGYLTVTLPACKKNGTYNATIRLYDDRGNLDDECYQHVNLTRYSKVVNDFSYASETVKKYAFNDLSLPSPGATIVSWNWSFGDGYYSESQNTTHIYGDKGSYNVTLIVWDSKNKSANKTIVLPVANSIPTVSFSANRTVVCPGKSIKFTSSADDSDGSLTNHTWDFGDGNYAYTTNATHSYSKSGFYTVILTVIDDDNATNSTAKTNYVVVADALVDDGFTDDPSNHEWDSIQEGINDVSDNEMIYVYNGNYQPYLVNKSVSIYGESKESIRLTTMPWAISIDIQSHDVYIKNFTIEGGMTGVNIISTTNGTGNTTIENGAIFGPMTYGIYIDNSTNNTIKDCSIDKADDGIKICNGAKYNVIDNCQIKGCINGVGIYSSSYNWVGKPSIHEWYPNDCEFTLNTNAVYIDESDYNYILGCIIDAGPIILSGPDPQTKGIYLDEASNTTICTCKVFNNSQQGIYFKDSRDNKVEFCLIIDNNYGIKCYGSNAKYNLIVQNNISGNTNYGVSIPEAPQCNKVYYNDFFDNGDPFTHQACDDHPPRLESPNEWCKVGGSLLTKSGLGEGNYWNDYTGSDQDSDGIGDSAYTIDGLAMETDDYPLMMPYGWCTGTGWD